MPFPYLIISDHNAHEFSSGGPLARHFGYRGWQRPDAPHAFRGGRPVGGTIPRSEWPALIKQGQGSFLSDLVKQQEIPAKDQNGLSLCLVLRLDPRGGSPPRDDGPAVPRPLAGERCRPLHRLAERRRLRQRGLRPTANRGACESAYMDAPHSLRAGRWQTGWQENAKLHEAVQWYEIEAGSGEQGAGSPADSAIHAPSSVLPATSSAGPFDEVITCLLNRIPVAAGLDWWGHLVCFLDPVLLPDGSVGVLFQNSWGVDWPTPGANGLAVLTERKATPDATPRRR